MLFGDSGGVSGGVRGLAIGGVRGRIGGGCMTMLSISCSSLAIRSCIGGSGVISRFIPRGIGCGLDIVTCSGSRSVYRPLNISLYSFVRSPP